MKSANELSVAVAATFTIEPISEQLTYFLSPFTPVIQFAPYNQVLQELLNPASLVSMHKEGLNVFFIRMLDFFHYISKFPEQSEIENIFHAFLVALKAHVAVKAGLFFICFCPHSLTPLPAWFTQLGETLYAEIRKIEGLYLFTAEDFQADFADEIFDPYLDKIGHIPFSQLFFTQMAYTLCRKIHAVLNPPRKVIILDCDNTLWKGIVGEDGPAKVQPNIPLQTFMISQIAKGKLLGLCSKNTQDDVWQVFANHPQMPLKSDHIVASRINWENKSDNLVELSAELNLGIDSFIFIDDNPIECAQLKSLLPKVMTIQIPAHAKEHEMFLRNHWAFDQIQITHEDLKRTEMYQQARARKKMEESSLSFNDFIKQLQLQINIQMLSKEEMARASQLTLRTNQFNATTKRYTEAELQSLIDGGNKIFRVCVEDRFGSYGLVGLMMANLQQNRYVCDSFLLSCRVLGKKVENEMLLALSRYAKEAGAATLELQYRFSEKNVPLRQFYQTLAGDQIKLGTDDVIIKLQVDSIPERIGSAEIDYLISSQNDQKIPPSKSIPPLPISLDELYQEIAECAGNPEKLLNKMRKSPLLPIHGPQELPANKNELTDALINIWKHVLRRDSLEVHDNFFYLGGNSLQATEVLSLINKKFSIQLPLHAFLESPTIEKLHSRLRNFTANPFPYQSLVVMGSSNSNCAINSCQKSLPNLFIFPGMFGQLFNLRILAEQLSASFNCFGLKARGTEDGLLPYASFLDMVKAYRAEIQTLQPHPPYLFLGYCSGGLIAYEIAHQMLRENLPDPFLILVDTRLPNPYYPQLTRKERWYIHGILLKQRGLRYLPAWLKARILWEWGKLKKLCLGSDPRKTPHDLRAWHVADAFTQAIKSYQVPLYEGPVWLYRPQQEEKIILGPSRVVNVQREFIFEDNGWSPYSKKLLVCEIPGDHDTLLEEPQVNLLAQQIKRNWEIFCRESL